MKRLYEVVTPCDPVTFRAENDQVAAFVVLYLGRGTWGLDGPDGDISTLIAFYPQENQEELIAVLLGNVSPDDFLERNREVCAVAMESFAYGKPAEREQFERACEAITDPEKLAEFKAWHEERQRSSMNRIVAGAWANAEALRRPAKGTPEVPR